MVEQNFKEPIEFRELKKFHKSFSDFLNIKNLLILIIIILITIIILFVFFAKEGGKNKSKESSLKEQLRTCLKMKNFDSGCNLLFTSPGIYTNCYDLGDLRDECFYKIAIKNHKENLCFKIIKNDLKNKCEGYLSSFPVFENE